MSARALVCTGIILSIACPAASAGEQIAGRTGDTRFGLVSVSYAAGFPLGNTKDFIDKASFRGGGVDIGAYPGEGDLYAGLSLQWTLFFSNASEYISLPDYDASGDQSRQLHMLPILAEVGYEWSIQDGPLPIHPFVRLGAGAYYVKKEVDFGITLFERTYWHAGFSPGAGVRIPLYRRIGGVIAVRYHYLFKSGDDPAHSYLTAAVGFTYVL